MVGSLFSSSLVLLVLLLSSSIPLFWQGCLCSSSGNRHDTEWEFSNKSRDRFSGAVQRALSRPPMWSLTQVALIAVVSLLAMGTEVSARYACIVCFPDSLWRTGGCVLHAL